MLHTHSVHPIAFIQLGACGIHATELHDDILFCSYTVYYLANIVYILSEFFN